MNTSRASAGRTGRKGFTLIELLVAVSLFAIAVAIAAGGFVRALRTQRQLIALISANSSASLAIEQIAREIRTGTGFTCAGVAGACDEITFRNARGDTVRYLLQDGALASQAGSASPQPLTPANTEVRNLQFLIFGGSVFPPRITITMGVTARGQQDLRENLTNLQTTVSGRIF